MACQLITAQPFRSVFCRTKVLRTALCTPFWIPIPFPNSPLRSCLPLRFRLADSPRFAAATSSVWNVGSVGKRGCLLRGYPPLQREAKRKITLFRGALRKTRLCWIWQVLLASGSMLKGTLSFEKLVSVGKLVNKCWYGLLCKLVRSWQVLWDIFFL